MSVLAFPAIHERCGARAEGDEMTQRVCHCIPGDTSAYGTTPPGWRPDRTVGLAVTLPTWVTVAGYQPIGFRVPRIGELFYDRARDKVLKSGEHFVAHGVNVAETREFVVLEFAR